MNTSPRLFVLIVTVLLCQCLTEIQCRRTISSSRRGSSRRHNYGSNSQTPTNTQQGGFFSFFGASKKSSSSTGSSTRTSSGTFASQTSKNDKPSWANPYYKPSAPKETNYGWVSGGRKQDANQFQKSSQPSSNIGPGGYPVQSGLPHQNTRVPQQTHGYNTGFQTHGFQPAPQTHGFQPAPQTHGYNMGQPSYSHSGHNTGYHANPPPYGQPSYPSNNFGHQSFASSHGISPNYYPSQSNLGYPGQGMFGGSHGPKFGGQGLFGGGTGNFGYGSNSWGVPTYGSKASSGKGKLLTGLALGAAGGYLTSSLVNKISNPWGYSGWGYGSRFGYDRPIVIKEIRETFKTEGPVPAQGPAPDPADGLISCVAIDPATNVTLINPNCSCTVTTVIDPMTNQPISTHNCTTANGQLLQPPPAAFPAEQMPPNAVNSPNASPSYAGVYGLDTRYGAGPEFAAPAAVQTVETTFAPTPTAKEEESGTVKTEISTSEASPAMQNDSPAAAAPSKVKEFYSQLEQIVSMGKFH